MPVGAAAFPTGRLAITRVTEIPPHPLDSQVAGIRARSNQAFRVVYEATVDDLASFAFGMVGDRRTAEDIVQQAFVELVEAGPRLKGDGRALRAWLFRAVRYGCLDEYRRRSRRPELPRGEVPDSAVDPEYLDGHLDPELDAALTSLTKRQRAVVLLFHLGDLSGEEIARVLGTTRRAVYGLLGRGEARLRDILEAGQ